MKYLFDKEKRQSNEFVVRTTMDVLGITRKEAQKRTDACIKSGLFEIGGPNEILVQLLIENFMRFDGAHLNYQDVFFATMQFPELISRYDFEKDSKLTKALKDIKDDTGQWENIKAEIEKFDRFFHDVIWTAFQKGYGFTGYKPQKQTA